MASTLSFRAGFAVTSARAFTRPSLLAVAVMLCAGCAAISSGAHPIQISTTPRGADIYVDGELAGKSPATLSLTTWQDKAISIEHPEYGPYRGPLPTKLNPRIWGNVFWPIGFLVDGMMGRTQIVASSLDVDLSRIPLEKGVDRLALYRIPEFQPPAGSGLLVVYREKPAGGFLTKPQLLINSQVEQKMKRGDILIKPVPAGVYVLQVRERNVLAQVPVVISEGMTKFVGLRAPCITTSSEQIANGVRVNYACTASLTEEPEAKAVRAAYHLVRK